MIGTEFFRLFRFGIIGLLAAGLHYCSVIIIVENHFAEPLLANIGGFMVAFWLSFFGHQHWTFKDHQTNKRQSFPRFLLTAIGGFCLNELLFYLMLHFLKIPYTIALAIAVFIVAACTFVVSKFWAFKSSGEPVA